MILDVTGTPQLKVMGPNCCVMCCRISADIEFPVSRSLQYSSCVICSFFQIFTLENQRIGEIRKMFSGIAQEMYTDADNFGITCEF